MAHKTAHQQRKYMREHGFRFINTTKHSDIWEDGYSRVAIATRPSSDPRAWWNIERDVQKALKLRKEKEEMEAKAAAAREPQKKIVASAPPKIGEPLTAKIMESVGIAPKPIKRPNFGVAYHDDDKELLKIRIKELSDQKKNNQEIAEILEKEGYKNAHGNPVSWSVVANFRSEMGLVKKYAPRGTIKKVVVEGKVVEPEVDPKLQAVKEAAERIAKVAPPKTLAELDQSIDWDELPPPVELPPPLVTAKSAATPATAPQPVVVQARSERVITDPMIQILKDPLLSDTKKVRMLLALLEDV